MAESHAEDHEATMKQALQLYTETNTLIQDLLKRQTQWGERRRRRSRDRPPDLSKCLQLPFRELSLLEHETALQKSLKEFFGILKEIVEVSKVAKDYHAKGNLYQIAGIAAVPAAVALGLFFAPLTFGLSVPLAVAGGTAGGAYLIKIAREYKNDINKIAEKIEKSVKEFQETLQQLKNNLIKIKSLGEKLQKSSVIDLSTVVLEMVKEVQKVLEPLSELGRILKLLLGEGFVGSVEQIYSQSEQVFTKLEELRTEVEAY